MRLLLVAYDFPPIPSPQAIRWAYMVRELAALGHKISVLTVDLPGYGPGGLPELPPQVRVHRCYPGPLSAFLQLRRRREIGSPPVESCDEALESPAERLLTQEPHPVQLNWKGLLAEALKSCLSQCIFPDYRGEWMPWARREMVRLIDELKPDCVVTSHEPASSLPLGILAKKKGCRWVADLGDPVLAPYTPWRWRRRAAKLERQVCSGADLVSVTTEGTAELLQRRHGLESSRCFVSPQGFDQSYRARGTPLRAGFETAYLELLYTGSFYSFRRADALLSAVVAVPGVRLNVATSKAPAYLTEVATKYPQSVRILGFLPHTTALDFQRHCDVLVSIANADSVQVPGKFNEYLGAGRPILHVSAARPSAVEALIEAMNLGWSVPADAKKIGDLLVSLNQKKLSGRTCSPTRNEQAVSTYSWRALARVWAERVNRIPRANE